MHENFVDERARAIGIRVNRNTYLMGMIQLGRWAMLTLPCKFFKTLFLFFSYTFYAFLCSIQYF